ncbi:MAG TPA: helix-turn-helix domain-containing protein [Gemmatimonadales bacterium]|jgi:DNA-binding NtrC family response regulator|nr:helix-turn-helix domain-containing protein [Gemmatimonadales bacterium]HET9514089.1 helix-turn-helix domain-containing protein [Gemmatimonadales bacterium]
MAGLSILVVSQDPTRARDIADALRQGGHSAVVQSDAAAAAADLSAAGLEATVIDLNLPGLDRTQLGKSLSPEAPNVPPEPLEAVERRHILATLLYTGGNKRRAAHLLGIARSTLIQKVRRYELKLPEAPGE